MTNRLRHTFPMANAAQDDEAHRDDGEPSGTDLATSERDDEQRPVGWARLGAILATTVGGLSLVGGLTWLLLNLHGPAPSVDVAVGAILAIGGLVLLMPHRLRLPRAATGIAAAVAGIGGTAAGLAAGSATVCCMFAYVAERGFPFRWLRRGGVADDPEMARRLAEASGWHVDVASLAVNLVVWAYAGILLVALVVLARRVVPGRAR
jgi:hypothetical protein